MFNVTVVLWLKAPDVAVTVMVLAPAGVPGFDGPPPLLPPPPHDEGTPTTSASMMSAVQRGSRSRHLRFNRRMGSNPADKSV